MLNIIKLDPTIKLDIRYATDNNFTHTSVYPHVASSVAYLQKPVINDLLAVQKHLKQYGYGLIIYDAYRPLSVTKKFYDITPDNEKHFVADPSEGSVHNRGAAVDCGLYHLSTGLPAKMPSEFDQPTDKSTTASTLLKTVMSQHNFIPFTPDSSNLTEWWHYDHKTSLQYPVMNIPFEFFIQPNLSFNLSFVILISLMVIIIILILLIIYYETI